MTSHAIPLMFALVAVVASALVWARSRCARHARSLAAERRQRAELEAYAALPMQLPPHGSPQMLARAVCAAVAEHSSFGSAALLLREAGAGLHVVGSCGVDDLLERALNLWGERFSRANDRNGARKSFTVTLGPLDPLFFAAVPKHDPLRQDPVRPVKSNARPNMCAVTMVPLRSSGGATLGILALTAPRAELRTLEPVDALTAQLARTVDNASLHERLHRAEKVAGLANIAHGVAHELHNPLTAVVGYAEMIAESCTDPRNAEDARAILAQAARMKETVAGMSKFRAQPMPADEPVDVRALVERVAARAKRKCAEQQIELALQLGDGAEAAEVRGDGERLASMLTQLLHHAIYAVARYAQPCRYDAASRPAELPPAIRLTLAHEQDTLQIVVSDTGSGFDDAARVFDPFYASALPGNHDGSVRGVDLAQVYRIAREHGGDISALNLHPHGAAVIVELPVARTLKRSGERMAVAAAETNAALSTSRR